MILVTGGAGFIGSNFVLDWLAQRDEPVTNLDKLTYAGNTENLRALAGDHRHVFFHGDICDRALVERLLATHRPRAIVHFAAESHVDRSIHGPADFMRTNVEGTFTLRAATGRRSPATKRRRFASSTSRPTRSTAASPPKTRRFARPTPTSRTVLT